MSIFHSRSVSFSEPASEPPPKPELPLWNSPTALLDYQAALDAVLANEDAEASVEARVPRGRMLADPPVSVEPWEGGIVVLNGPVAAKELSDSDFSSFVEKDRSFFLSGETAYVLAYTCPIHHFNESNQGTKKKAKFSKSNSNIRQASNGSNGEPNKKSDDVMHNENSVLDEVENQRNTIGKLGMMEGKEGIGEENLESSLNVTENIQEKPVGINSAHNQREEKTDENGSQKSHSSTSFTLDEPQEREKGLFTELDKDENSEFDLHNANYYDNQSLNNLERSLLLESFEQSHFNVNISPQKPKKKSSNKINLKNQNINLQSNENENLKNFGCFSLENESFLFDNGQTKVSGIARQKTSSFVFPNGDVAVILQAVVPSSLPSNGVLEITQFENLSNNHHSLSNLFSSQSPSQPFPKPYERLMNDKESENNSSFNPAHDIYQWLLPLRPLSSSSSTSSSTPPSYPSSISPTLSPSPSFTSTSASFSFPPSPFSSNSSLSVFPSSPPHPSSPPPSSHSHTSSFSFSFTNLNFSKFSSSTAAPLPPSSKSNSPDDSHSVNNDVGKNDYRAFNNDSRDNLKKDENLTKENEIVKDFGENLMNFRSLNLEPQRFISFSALEGLHVPQRIWKRHIAIYQPIRVESYDAECGVQDFICLLVENCLPQSGETKDVVIKIDSIILECDFSSNSKLQDSSNTKTYVTLTEMGMDQNLNEIYLRPGEQYSFILKPMIDESAVKNSIQKRQANLKSQTSNTLDFSNERNVASKKNNKSKNKSSKKSFSKFLSTQEAQNISFKTYLVNEDGENDSVEESDEDDDNEFDFQNAEFSVIISCSSSHTDSKLHYAHVLTWHPRMSRDLLLSITIGKSKSNQFFTPFFPEEITIKATNLTQKELDLIFLAPNSMAATPLSRLSFPTLSSPSPFVRRSQSPFSPSPPSSPLASSPPISPGRNLSKNSTSFSRTTRGGDNIAKRTITIAHDREVKKSMEEKRFTRNFSDLSSTNVYPEKLLASNSFLDREKDFQKKKASIALDESEKPKSNSDSLDTEGMKKESNDEINVIQGNHDIIDDVSRSHVWMQSVVLIGKVPAGGTAEIKCEILPLNDGIIALDTIHVATKKRDMLFIPENPLEIYSSSNRVSSKDVYTNVGIDLDIE